jgi:L-seryl-tRNA(Ser) seleniumtransferase
MMRLASHSIREVINATGVILHTNLGRSPLGPCDVVQGYSNLEYDLASGKRGRRDIHLTDLLEALLGTAAIVVNNNASAVYLVLHELAVGREVIISRGELVEIGDGFRVSDIMVHAGAVLREVGTTNCTHIEDYRQAITDRTALLLRVHPSNFSIRGYTKKPTLSDLSALASETGIPLYEDLGSGCMADLRSFGVNEPLVKDSLAAGVALVSFSGDKLLGGPQAGLIAGKPDLIARLRRNPMYRGLRVDKVILHLLRATLTSLLFERWDALPAINMLRQSQTAIRKRAEHLSTRLAVLEPEVIHGESLIGGGSTPDQTLPTALIAISPQDVVAFEYRLRCSSPPIIARIDEKRIVIDLRTVFPHQEEQLVNALLAAREALPPNSSAVVGEVV